MTELLKRYEAVDVITASRITGTPACISYLDMFDAIGDRLRTCIEPIAEEL